MGAKCNSSTERNKELQQIGEQTKIKHTQSLIRLDSKIIVSEFQSNLEEDYKRLKFLGQGSFASVYQVQNRLTGIYRAMKSLKRKTTSGSSGNADKVILNEINILREMDHPNILKIFGFYANPKSYDIITELCVGGELFDELDKNGPFTEKKCAYVMYQILSAVNYCHKMKIIHRDLKPENILIIKREDEDNELLFIKICDFGTAKWFEDGKIERSVVGSCYYIAPEVLQKNYDEKCDLWSIGVIMYILLSGKPPFGGENEKEIFKKILDGDYDLKEYPWNEMSSDAKDLISNLLLMNSKKRFSAEEALNHKWFTKHKSKELFTKIENKVITEKLINNLINYKSNSVIQQAALAYLVHNFNQTRYVINACKLFAMIDTDGDGRIKQEEIYEGLKKIVNRKNLESECHKIFENIDMNHNIYVEYEEFVRGAVNKEQFLSDNVLKFAFRYFDKDGNTEIDYREIESIFKDNIYDKNKIHDGLKKIIDEVDSNKDGKISYHEFCVVMKKMISP